MIDVRRAAPTRLNLLRARRDLSFVARGTTLVRQKRQALVRELFRQARPALDARAAVARQVSRAGPPLWDALVAHGYDGLRAMSWPLGPLEVVLQPATLWGLAVSRIVSRPTIRRTVEARGIAPGRAGPAAAETAAQFETLAELLLDAAVTEQALRRLGEAVATSTRQLRVLELRIAPALTARIATLSHILDEREREEHVRLDHVRRQLQRESSVDRAP